MCGSRAREHRAWSVSPSSLPRPAPQEGNFGRNLRSEPQLLQESRAKLAFSRPGNFAGNYVKPMPSSIVGDGSRVLDL